MSGIGESSAAVYKNITMVRDYTPSTHEISQIKKDLQTAKDQCYTFKESTAHIISGMPENADPPRKTTYQEKALNAVKTVSYCALFLGVTTVVVVATPFISLYFLLRTIARGEVFQQAENFSKIGQCIRNAYAVCNPDVETLHQWLDQGHTYRVKFYAHSQMLDPAVASLALVKACHDGDASIVRALMKACNDQVNVANEDGHTPLFQAIEQGHQTLWPVLVEAGACVKEGTLNSKSLSVKADHIKFFIKNNPEHPQVAYFKSLIPAEKVAPENSPWSYDVWTNYAYSYLQAGFGQLKNASTYVTEQLREGAEIFTRAQVGEVVSDDEFFDCEDDGRSVSDDGFFDCGEEDTIFIQNT